jgi:hypothetical protein
VVPAVVNIRVALPPALVMLFDGLNTAVTPGGNVDVLRVTACALPLVRVAVMVEVLEAPPWDAVTDSGFADTEKSFVTGALTTSVTVMAALNPEAPVPLTVTE